MLRGAVKELFDEKQKAEKILGIVKQELKKEKSSRTTVIVKMRGDSFQFYLREADETLKYLPIKEQERVADIVKAEYYNKLKLKLEKRIRVINRSIRGLEDTDINHVYEIMGKGKQKLLEKFTLTDEQFRAEWEACEYRGKEKWDESTEIYTDKGERVRSKSEKIIADKLYKESIAYRYEYPLEIPHVATIYPDFTILDERKRKTIIYEHFGLMDNEEYVNKALSKIQTYAKEGYVLGDNFFFTMETKAKPLDSRVLDGIIDRIKG